MKPVWQARTTSGLDPAFEAYSQCVDDDAPYLLHDLAGSIAHVMGLHQAGLLEAADATALVEGLQAIAKQVQAGSFTLDPALEDGHMNLESALTDALGEPAKRLHTGRSRNDQVATCLVLRSREGLLALARQAHALAQALAVQAAQHTTTPWTARTHGRPAQPATIGFLLAAHAARMQDVAKLALQTFDAVGESPLGSGAVAGSTLPLDPAYTANLLGLRPVRSALLAAGSRDTVTKTLWPAVQAGQAAASLAQELVGLFADGAFEHPPGFTTGSSLMPHKRNPDALELVRGKGQAITGHLNQILAITGGNALGYLREYQLTKPVMDAALGDAINSLDILARVVSGGTFGAGKTLPDAGLIATDLAEALVAQGMPFRIAYGVIAAAWAAHEAGAELDDALAIHVPAHLLGAVQGIQPDASRRTTRGAPGPQQVQQALSELAAAAVGLAENLAAAEQETQLPSSLLTTPTNALICPEVPA